jgi:prevent-host-death family protein
VNKVKIAELKNNLSRYLAYVREGGEVLVLDRDTPIARLVPFGCAGARTSRAGTKERWAEDRLADMERQGLIKRGDPKTVDKWLDGHKPIRLPRGSGSVLETLLTMRDEDTR